MLNQQDEANAQELHISGSSIPNSQSSKSGKELAQLKIKLHQLEVESRVLLHENERYRH